MEAPTLPWQNEINAVLPFQVLNAQLNNIGGPNIYFFALVYWARWLPPALETLFLPRRLSRSVFPV